MKKNHTRSLPALWDKWDNLAKKLDIFLRWAGKVRQLKCFSSWIPWGNDAPDGLGQPRQRPKLSRYWPTLACRGICLLGWASMLGLAAWTENTRVFWAPKKGGLLVRGNGTPKISHKIVWLVKKCSIWPE